jgi:hypothetical protein
MHVIHRAFESSFFNAFQKIGEFLFGGHGVFAAEIGRDYVTKPENLTLWAASPALSAIIAGCIRQKRQTGLGSTRTMRPWLKVQSLDAAPQGFAKRHPRFFVDEIHSG